MNERDLRLLRRLYDRLQSVEHEIRSIRNSQERQEKQRDIQPLWINPILAEHKQAEANNTTNQEKHYRVQKSLKRAAWCAFFAAAVYGGVAYWQKLTMDKTLREAQKQTPEISKSANAAKDAANTAATTMQLDERAWLAVRYPMIQLNVGSRISVPLVFENTGKTPAKNLAGVISVTVTDANATPDFSYARGYYSWDSGYLSQSTTAPTRWNALDARTRQDLILSKPILDAIQSGDKVVTVHGRIEYDDIFRIHHWLKFCQQAAGQPTGMTVSTNTKCTQYNQIDDNQ
jgi:hypothetical protein